MLLNIFICSTCSTRKTFGWSSRATIWISRDRNRLMKSVSMRRSMIEHPATRLLSCVVGFVVPVKDICENYMYNYGQYGGGFFCLFFSKELRERRVTKVFHRNNIRDKAFCTDIWTLPSLSLSGNAPYFSPPVPLRLLCRLFIVDRSPLSANCGRSLSYRDDILRLSLHHSRKVRRMPHGLQGDLCGLY